MWIRPSRYREEAGMLGYVLFLLCLAYIVVWVAYYVTAFMNVAPRADEDSVTNTLLIFSALKPVVAALVMFCMIFSIYDPGTLFLLVVAFGVIWSGTLAMGAKLLVDYLTCNTPSNPSNLCNDLLFCCAYYATVFSCAGDGPCPGVTPDTLQVDGDFKLIGIFTLVFIFMEVLIIVTAFAVLMRMKKNFKDAVVSAEVMERWFDGDLTESYERLLDDVRIRQDKREEVDSMRAHASLAAPSRPHPLPSVPSRPLHPKAPVVSNRPTESVHTSAVNAEHVSSIVKPAPVSSTHMKAKTVGDSITIAMNPAGRDSGQKKSMTPSTLVDSTKTRGNRTQKPAHVTMVRQKSPSVVGTPKSGSLKNLKTGGGGGGSEQHPPRESAYASVLRTRNPITKGANKNSQKIGSEKSRPPSTVSDKEKSPPSTVPSLIKSLVSTGTIAMKNWLKAANLYAWYHVDKYAIEEMFMTKSPNHVRVKRSRRKKKKN